jgi:hypothetical protein
VVEVRVAEHDGVDARRVEREVAVPFERVLAMALEQAAVEQYPTATRVDQVRGARDLARGAPEFDVHAAQRSAFS